MTVKWKRNATVKEMLIEKLKTEGYDGLFNEGNECGCELSDLIPCGEDFSGCEPGVKRPCGDKCGLSCAGASRMASDEDAWHIEAKSDDK